MFINENSRVLASESSLRINVYADRHNPYWAESHIHFGRFNVVNISVIITSDKEPADNGYDFLTNTLHDLDYELCQYFGLIERDLKVEINLSVFYFGIRVCHAPVIGGEGFRGLIAHTQELILIKLNGGEI